MDIMNYHLTLGINIWELKFSTLIITSFNKALNDFVQNILLGF